MMKVWETVKHYEETTQQHLDKVTGELNEAKANVIVNYGENGRIMRGLVNRKMRLTEMVITIFKYYEATRA